MVYPFGLEKPLLFSGELHGSPQKNSSFRCWNKYLQRRSVTSTLKSLHNRELRSSHDCSCRLLWKVMPKAWYALEAIVEPPVRRQKSKKSSWEIYYIYIYLLSLVCGIGGHATFCLEIVWGVDPCLKFFVSSFHYSNVRTPTVGELERSSFTAVNVSTGFDSRCLIESLNHSAAARWNWKTTICRRGPWGQRGFVFYQGFRRHVAQQTYIFAYIPTQLVDWGSPVSGKS